MSYKNTYFPCKVIYITVEHFSIDTLKIFNIISSLHWHGMRESRRGSLNKKLKDSSQSATISPLFLHWKKLNLAFSDNPSFVHQTCKVGALGLYGKLSVTFKNREGGKRQQLHRPDSGWPFAPSFFDFVKDRFRTALISGICGGKVSSKSILCYSITD